MFLKIKLSSSILTICCCEWTAKYRGVLILAFCVAFSNLFIGFAIGQSNSKAASDQESENAPEKVTLETKDKVELVCTYFPPVAPEKPDASKDAAAAPETEPESKSAAGKRTITYIILHDWKSSRKDTKALATFLSARGNAVITPDLRGHGDSTRVIGVEKAINSEDFTGNEIGSTIEDIETCKRFLVKKNNAGELNVDMLAVIAIGETVPLATEWVVKDWSFAPYSKGIKQGQDVKFLIMIAPEKKLGPFSMTRITNAPIFAGQTALPTIVSWGTSSKTAKDSQSILNRLKKKRPEKEDETVEEKTLFLAPLQSSRSGVQIGSDQTLTKLWQFFDKTVSGKLNQNIDKMPWQDRSKEP
ncbi:hypothetical protein N9Y42_02625 [Mariniblastus sp.]|nr:hypothetical protein [Mariniblastus sp.]